MRLSRDLVLIIVVSAVSLSQRTGRAEEVASSTVREQIPDRFLFTFYSTGNGHISLLLGRSRLVLHVGSDELPTGQHDPHLLHAVLPERTSSVELLGLSGNNSRADLFINGGHVGSVNVEPGRPSLSIKARGNVQVKGVRFSSLPEVRFRDDFMRDHKERGDWNATSHGLQIERSVNPEHSASPFNLISREEERSEMRTGNRFWWKYHAACAVLLPQEDEASAAIGSHLRDGAGLWSELSRSGKKLRFRAFTTTAALTGKRDEILLEHTIFEYEPGWHEIAVSPSSAALDGEVFEFADPPAFPGGSCAVAATGKGVRIDEVRCSSEYSSAAEFLQSWWNRPGDVQGVFRSKNDMAMWSRGRFVWDTGNGSRRAEFRYPLQGERELALGELQLESGPLFRVTLASGIEVTVSGTQQNYFKVDVISNGSTKKVSIPRAGSLRLKASKTGVFIDGRKVAGYTGSLAGKPEISRLGRRWPGSLELSCISARDHTFSRAPTLFEPISGRWLSTSRWRCSPDYNWFGGRGDPAHSVYRYRLEGKRSSVALAFAPAMQKRNGPFYNYPMGLVIGLSPDPLDPFTGAAVVWEVLTAPSRLVIAGKTIAFFDKYATDRRFPNRFQKGFQATHRRWDVVRLFRDGEHLRVTVNDKTAFDVSDPAVAAGRYLHLLAPSKAGAMISRLFVASDSLVPCAGEIRPQTAALHKPVRVSTHLGEFLMGAPPPDNTWAMFMGSAAGPVPGPDVLLENGAGFTARVDRPGLRWATGFQLPSPARLSEISFKLELRNLPGCCLYLDTGLGPVCVPLGERAVPGPYHLVKPEHDNGRVKVDLTSLDHALGGRLTVHGFYWGELQRDEESVFGLAGSISGRTLTVKDISANRAANGFPQCAPSLATASISIIRADGDKEEDLPVLPVTLALGGDPEALRKTAGMEASLGYTDGAGLFHHQNRTGLCAVNPRMGGPAGIWLSRTPFHKHSAPVILVQFEDLEPLPALPWNLVAATEGGKAVWNISDNNARIPFVGSAVTRTEDGIYLVDLRRCRGKTINALALMDPPWYSSVEWAGLNLKGVEPGPSVCRGDTLVFHGTGRIEYSFINPLTRSQNKTTGTALDGRIVIPPLSNEYYLLTVTDGDDIRTIPLIVEQKRTKPSASIDETAGIAPRPVMTVLPSSGIVRTDFTEDSHFSPLVCNRRGVLPVVDPPPGWIQSGGLDTERLGGGLFAEALGSSREGYYLLQQDSGIPEGCILRVMYACSGRHPATLVFYGDHYSPIRKEHTAANSGWTWYEHLLPYGTDAVSMMSRGNTVALRAVSVAPVTERRFAARFHYGGPEDIFRLEAHDRQKQSTVIKKTLPAGTATVDFELPGPGSFTVTGFQKNAAGAERRLNEVTLSVR